MLPSLVVQEPSPRQATPWFGLADRLRRPVANGAYSPEIDGLRFIAVAIVVIGHFMERAVRFFPVAQDELAGSRLADILLRPGLGVYLFFAVSGFILARQAMKVTASPLSARFLKTYFGRRLLRIEPPYVILLVVTWVALSLTGYAPDKTNHFDAVPRSLDASLVGSVLYMHDLVWGTYPRLFPPGWSLEIEVQFYLTAPVLFWAFVKARSRVTRILLGAAGLAGGAFLSLVAPAQIGPLHTSASIFQFFHFFWLGIVIAHLRGWIVEKTEGLPSMVTGALGWLGLTCYLALPNAPDNDIAVAMVFRATTLAALFAMFVSVFAAGSSFRAFCARPWIAVLGGACYSVYLTHLQVIQVATALLAKLAPGAGLGRLALFLVLESAAVVAVGLLFYALIERTFMQKDWPRRSHAVAVAMVRKLRFADTYGGEAQVVAGRSSGSRAPR